MAGEIVRAKPIVPLAQMEHRLPEQGRIRFGVKKVSKAGKEYPSKIDTMRFTSHDKGALTQLATVVGGKVVSWEKGPRAGEYDLISTTTSLRVALPTNVECLTQWYEKWTAGGCERRCDGVKFETSRPTPDGAEVTEVPCVCAKNNVLECEAITRMSLLIRDAPFGGVWRFDTKSEIARAQLPEMVNLIKAMQSGGGVVPALLIMKEFSDKKEVWDKQSRSVKLLSRTWKVPTIALDGITIDDLIAGRGSLGALASGEQVRPLAIAAAAPVPQAAIEADANELADEDYPVPLNRRTRRESADVLERHVGEEDVVDGELVDESAQWDGGMQSGKHPFVAAGGGAPGDAAPPGGDEVEPESDGNDTAGAPGSTGSSIERMRKKLHALVRDCVKKDGPASGVDPDRFRHAAVRTATGMDQSSSSLMPDELSRVLDLVDSIAARRVRFAGISEHGQLRVIEPS